MTNSYLEGAFDYKRGDSVVIKPGWEDAGRIFKVLGPAVFVYQWWVPVIDPEDSDPMFFKAAGLEKYNAN